MVSIQLPFQQPDELVIYICDEGFVLLMVAGLSRSLSRGLRWSVFMRPSCAGLDASRIIRRMKNNVPVDCCDFVDGA